VTAQRPIRAGDLEVLQFEYSKSTEGQSALELKVERTSVSLDLAATYKDTLNCNAVIEIGRYTMLVHTGTVRFSVTL
jgi:hypothetical protein